MTKISTLKTYAFAMLLFPLLMLSGCEGLVGPSTPTEFYRLTAVDLSGQAKGLALSSELKVGVGPISIPGYADRSQIVSSGKGGKLIVDDLHHWAEPIHENIERVMVSNISSILSRAQVFSYPANFTPEPSSYQVAIEIIEMILLEDGKVQLAASWNVKKMLNNRLMKRQAINYISQKSATDLNDYSQILSGLLGQLALDITASLQEVTN
ncbi:PqiC family protein [Sneathiella limimaris]|uniref:PqiC family protein n=1 Tax=Sneathiella limimaris TaxID=1964213 RepID=UPI00146F4608|nr:PqiC family protein [Sneathiella limimaris]